MSIGYTCPYCGGPLRKKGISNGVQRYVCKVCNKNCSGNPPKKTLFFKEINEKNIACPYCDSKNLKSSGYTYKGLRKYYCSDCKHKFTEKTKERLRLKELKPSSKETCPRCGGKRIISAGKGKTGKSRFRCLDCKRTYTKGAKLLLQDLKRKPPLTLKDKKELLMFRLNLDLPRKDLAKHFNCSEYSIKQLEREYLKSIGVKVE